jgi:hypothetical protein
MNVELLFAKLRSGCFTQDRISRAEKHDHARFSKLVSYLTSNAFVRAGD